MTQPVQSELSIQGAGASQSLWGSLRHGKVSFRMGRLEPQLAWAMAAYTAWAAVWLHPMDPRVWAVAVYAAGIGWWGMQFPAHHQWLMFVRGVLLLCGAFVLQVSAGSGAPAGSFFVLAVMASTVYALMLAQRWAIVLAALALLQHAAAWWLAGTGGIHLHAAQAGVLCIFPWVATAFGRALREMDQQAELARMDRHSQLYNEAGFFSHGAELLRACRSRKRPFSMVLLNCADLGEVADLAGKQAANQLFTRLVTELGRATPREGIAARTDMTEFALALPGCSAEKAGALLQQCLGNPPKVELMARGNKVTVILDSLVAEATPDVPGLEDFYDRMRARMLKRFNVEPALAPGEDSTLQGLLEDDRPVPHFERPTMPMAWGKARKR